MTSYTPITRRLCVDTSAVGSSEFVERIAKGRKADDLRADAARLDALAETHPDCAAQYRSKARLQRDAAALIDVGIA